MIRISTFHPLLLGVSLMAIAATGALAQEDDTARDTFLGAITIDGSGNPTAPLDGMVATSAATTKTGTPILETPSSVSVVPRAQIVAQGATSLVETLGYSAGIVTENYGGDPRFDSLYLRGFNLENDKFLDGLRLMRSTQYPTSAPSFELYGLERVEVLRGPASVLYGAGTPAGLVNMVQKRAQADGDFSAVGAAMDSNGSYAIYGDANRVVDDRFAYRITAKAGNSKTDVAEIDNERAYLGLSASYALSDATELEFMASLHDDAPISTIGVPNAFVDTVDLKEMRDFFFGEPGMARSDRQMTTLGFGVTHEFASGWKLNGTFRSTNFDWHYDQLYLGGTTGSSVARGFHEQREDFRALALDLRLSGTATTGAVEHGLTFGLDAQKHKEHAETYFYDMASLDYAAPVYGNTAIGTRTYDAVKDVDARQIGLYAMDEMTWGNWRATAALRHEWTRQTGQNLTNFGDTDFAREDSETTFHTAIGYSFDSGVATYLSYATSYLPQAGVDIDDNPLKPTRGKQWELGLKYEPTSFDGLFTAALFDLTETDRNTQVGTGWPAEYRQLGKVRIQGLELEGVAELAEGWHVKGAYTYASTRISGDADGGDNDGNELANTPRHSASLWLSYDVTTGRLAGLTLGGGLRHIGERWANDTNTQRLEAVTLMDLGASYAWDNGVVARLNITNVTDEAYISAVGFNSSYIGDGRNVQASLDYSW